MKQLDDTFSRAAWFVRDWMEIIEIGGRMDDPALGNIREQYAEAKVIVERLDEMAKHVNEARKHQGAASAAAIIGGMLRDYQLVGSVWYSPLGRRFRLSGDGHKPADGEVFIGAYLPDCDQKELAEDFAFAMAEQIANASNDPNPKADEGGTP